MPLVFVHGVANRPGPERVAEIKQRNSLFRSLVFGGNAIEIFNPDWGSKAAKIAAGLPWLPIPDRIQPFAAGDVGLVEEAARSVGLGRIAKIDGAQAVDLAVSAALENAIAKAPDNNPDAAASPELIAIVKRAATYLEPRIADLSAPPKGIVELDTGDDDLAFADALSEELEAVLKDGTQAFGIGDTIRDAVSALAGWVGNGVSDAVLRLKRRSLSQDIAFFLGDIFVYLRQRDVEGETGTRTRLFEPIIVDLIKAARVQRAAGEPFIVIGHSLGGVLLYDLLTDPSCIARLAQESPDFRIDAWLTVGSQPGFFADLGLFQNKPMQPSKKFKKPANVAYWMNIYDFTDVFSFLCAPFFEDVNDYGYDTAIDIFQAHSAYFKRPSFYKRLEVRLKQLGHL